MFTVPVPLILIMLKIGSSNSTASDIFVIKMNSDGLIQWKKQFGKESKLQYISTSANNENGYGITIDSAGSVLVAGSSDGSFVNNGAGNQDAVILKLNLLMGISFGEDSSVVLIMIDAIVLLQILIIMFIVVVLRKEILGH